MRDITPTELASAHTSEVEALANGASACTEKTRLLAQEELGHRHDSSAAAPSFVKACIRGAWLPGFITGLCVGFSAGLIVMELFAR